MIELIQNLPPQELVRMLGAEGSSEIKSYHTLAGHTILFSTDTTPKGKLKHISISHFTRYPNWDELLDFKEQLLGDIDAMLVMPKKADYVNLHKTTFHIWQTPTEWNIQ